MYHLKVRVHPKSRPFLYEKIELSDSNAKVPCVDFVKHSCKDLNGNLSWYKVWTPLVTFRDSMIADITVYQRFYS